MRKAQIWLSAMRCGAALLYRGGLRRESAAALGAMVRERLEALGGVFLLFGQTLAMRRDCLPGPFCEALENIRDRSQQFDAADAIHSVERELGRPILEAFTFFDKNAAAVDWMGQSHRASVDSDSPVIVTVRRPGLAAAVEADLATLGPVLLLADFCAVAGRVRLSSHFAQIRPAVLDGLSFLTVARRTDRLASQAADNPREYIPHVYWEHTTANVITLEAVSGASLDDVAEAARQNSAAVTAPSEDPPAGCVDARKVARNLLYNHLRQVLNGRYLNCHPAAKTLVVLDDHSIAYLDCRAVYRLDSRFADRQMEVISAARAGDVNALFQSLWECLEAPADAPAAEFESSFHARVSEWLDLAEDPRAAPDARSVLALLDGILDDCRRCQIPAPHSLVACHHAFGETVACVREVAPEIDMEAELAATLQEMLTERIEKSIDTRTLSQTVLEYEQFLVTLPHQLRQVMRSIRQERAPLERSVNVWELRSWGLAQLLATLAIPATAAVWAWRQWNPAPAIAVVITLLLLRRASRLGYERSAVGHRRVRVN